MDFAEDFDGIWWILLESPILVTASGPEDFKCSPECASGYYGVKSDEWEDGLGALGGMAFFIFEDWRKQ